MRLVGFLAALIPSLLLTTGVAAQTVYRCVKADGSVYIGQEPPAPGTCVEQSTTQWEPTPAAAPQSALPRSDARPAPSPGLPPNTYSLWERREGRGPWNSLVTFEGQGGCQVELERRTRSAQARILNAYVDEPGTVKLRGEGDREYVSYRCLPEGIRPS
jgi:hypothetical protein